MLIIIAVSLNFVQGNGRNVRLHEEDNGLNLFLENADISDAGEYQCVAENDNEVGKLQAPESSSSMLIVGVVMLCGLVGV